MMRTAATAAVLTMLSIACGQVACAAAAAEYPTKPIRFTVPSAPGGTPDIIARVVSAELTKQMGQQVVALPVSIWAFSERLGRKDVDS